MIPYYYHTVFLSSDGDEYIGHHHVGRDGSDWMFNTMKLPRGSIKKLIGRDIKEGESIKLKEV